LVAFWAAANFDWISAVLAMKEQNRIRIHLITSRYKNRRNGPADSDRAAGFFRDVERVIASGIRPVMEDLGEELRHAGHYYRIELDVAEHRPSIDFVLLLAGANADAKNIIRFFAWRSPEKELEVVSEIEMKHIMEITRHKRLDEITRDVIEQLLVDAVEHIFACNGG
jgi:hypothetical protein